MSQTKICEPCWTGDNCVSKLCDECIEGDVCLTDSDYFNECPSTFAGPTCGNKITSWCNKATGAFCTNGGKCGSYIIDHLHYEGCHCDMEYFGAHCQYEAEIWVRGIPGEASVPQIGPKFYTKDIYKPDVPIGYMFISAGLVCFFLAFCAVLLKYVTAAEKLKTLQVRVTKELDCNKMKDDSQSRRHLVHHIVGLEENVDDIVRLEENAENNVGLEKNTDDIVGIEEKGDDIVGVEEKGDDFVGVEEKADDIVGVEEKADVLTEENDFTKEAVFV